MACTVASSWRSRPRAARARRHRWRSSRATVWKDPPGRVARAVEFAVRAAARAIELLAHDEAVALLERAVAAVEAAGDPPELRAPRAARPRRGAHRQRRRDRRAGRLFARSPPWGGGWTTMTSSLARPWRTAACSWSASWIRFWSACWRKRSRPNRHGDSSMRARLLARLGAALQPTNTSEEPLAVVREAIAVAGRARRSAGASGNAARRGLGSDGCR